MLAQGEVIRVIDEMNLSMKTYQQCFEQCQSVNEKVTELEQKLQSEEISTRKRRSLQKNLLKVGIFLKLTTFPLKQFNKL